MAWLLTNSQKLIKTLLNDLFLPILLDKKRKRNGHTFNKNTSSEDIFLIFLFDNFFEYTFLLFLLYSLIVSPSFHLSTCRLCVSIFGKNNTKKAEEITLELKYEEIQIEKII